jgi:hypothetical protein
MNINKNQIESIRQSFASGSGCCTKQAMKQWLNPNVPDGPPPAECCGLEVDPWDGCTWDRIVLSRTISMSSLDCCVNLEITSATVGGDFDADITVEVGFNTYNFGKNDTQVIPVCPHNNIKINYETTSCSEDSVVTFSFKNLDCPRENIIDPIVFNSNCCTKFSDFSGTPFPINETITYYDAIEGCLPNDPYESSEWTIPANWCPFTLVIDRPAISPCGNYDIYINDVKYEILDGVDYEYLINPGDRIYFAAQACAPPIPQAVVSIPLRIKECNIDLTTIEYYLCP